MAQETPIAVIGGGLMGHGIALTFARAGHPVTVTDPVPAALATVPERIAESLGLLGAGAASQWLEQRISTVRRLVGSDEEPALDRIEEAAKLKLAVDAHYVIQRSLKLWVAVHVVLTAAVLSLAVWHLILVHVYAR